MKTNLKLAGLHGKNHNYELYIPLSFMNICGINVKMMLKSKNLKTSDLCVFHDDLEIKKSSFQLAVPG